MTSYSTPESSLPENELKQTIKEAFSEALLEQRELLYDVIADVLEDFAFTEAIREGRETEFIERDEVLQTLRDSA